jgi:hypothetical protein
MPLYLHIWYDKTADTGLRDTVLELIADHVGKRGLFIFTGPSMVLSMESRYWALSYDYLNSNASAELVDFLIVRYYAGDATTRLCSLTALSYLKDNSVLTGHRSLRTLLVDAVKSPDKDIRFRAIQAFGPIATAKDIPALLLHLGDDDKNVADAAGALLRYLGKLPLSGEGTLRGLRELALAAARVQEKGYPRETAQQLGSESLGRLWSLMFSSKYAEADAYASELARRARQILSDIATAKFVSFWNQYKFSTASPSFLGKVPRNSYFGVTVTPAAGKVNYGQIAAMGAGRVIYCTDAAAWDRDAKKERERFMLHRSLAEGAGLEQTIRINVFKDSLGDLGTFSASFNQILRASHYGQGAKTKIFEISLMPGIDPVEAYKDFAALVREAASSVKRLDESIKLIVGTIVLGDRRWYGSKGAIESLLYHSFEDGERFRGLVDGVSIASNLPPASLEIELNEFMKSFRLSESESILWCTGLGQATQERRGTTVHLERDIVRSIKDACELPACVALLTQAGVSAIFFDPFKDCPVPGDPGTVTLNGLLYRDCMPKPVYHTARLVVQSLRKCKLASSYRYDCGAEVNAVLFPATPQPAVIAWAARPGAVAQIEVNSPFVRVTSTLPDAVGNFRSTFVEAKDKKSALLLPREAVIVEQVQSRPPASAPESAPGRLDTMKKMHHLGYPMSSCQKSYGSHDRSGGNDDGFSGTSSYLYRKEDGEYVIFDARGPGVVQRLWLGRVKGISRIRFYFDDGRVPGIDMTPAEMFGGKKPPFRYPLASSGDAAGGGSILTVPIWFSGRLVIATAGAPRFCQVDYALLDPLTEVVNSDARELERQSDSLAGVAKYLSRDIKDIHANCSPYSIAKKVELPPGRKVDVCTLRGPAMIKCLRVRTADQDDMKHVILQIHWDGSGTAGVGCPLEDMFGLKYGSWHWQGHAVGYMGGEGYVHYPMPFAKSAKVVLTNTGSDATNVSVSITAAPFPSPEAGKRYFCCHWKNAVAAPREETKPPEGAKLLTVNGAGHFVGCILSIHSRGDLSYLDSDILIFADGASVPLVHATGTDDYFGGANFYEGGRFSLPCCGLLAKKDAAIVQYRFHVTDAISFKNSFSFQIEELPPGARQAVYSGAFFWYSDSPSGGDSR